VAVAALVVVLVGLALFSGWIGYRGQQLSETTRRASALNDAFQEARYALAEQEALELEYRLVPDPSLRQEHRRAADLFGAAIGQAYRLGDAHDRAVIAEIKPAHVAYLEVTQRLLMPSTPVRPLRSVSLPSR
jgi:hypothetical protein